jgi:hypothetical protein
MNNLAARLTVPLKQTPLTLSINYYYSPTQMLCPTEQIWVEVEGSMVHPQPQDKILLPIFLYSIALENESQ